MYNNSKTWVRSGVPGADNCYNDFIVGSHGLHAQGSADIAISGPHFYANERSDRAIWRKGQRQRKAQYRGQERKNVHAKTVPYAEVRSGVWAVNARVWQGEILSCDGYTNWVPKKFRK